ncbi:hypothetical protein HK102_009706 [Quaeritorhiza haematococci]|nr:hypothetical protein HK102_009706 [Quaeritorhiza haematococci]
MYIDDLPIMGTYFPLGHEHIPELIAQDLVRFVGVRRDRDDDGPSDLYVFTHKDFSISYNKNQIIEINVTSSENPVRLAWDGQDVNITFTYSVTWVPTEQPFETRFNKYLDSDFFEHKIHWFSIFNSFMMVIFLTGLVGVILLRALKRDYARYDKEEGLLDLDRDLGDEYGWKQVHGDVFRSPSHLSIISAMCGSGMQLTVLSLILILYAIVGDLYVE